jgi:hypothetical protein
MDSKDHTPGEQKTSQSSSQELFEKLFRQAKMELKKAKGAKPSSEQPAPESEPEQLQLIEKTPVIKKTGLKTAGPLPRKGKTLKATPPGAPHDQEPVAPAPKTVRKKAKSSSAPKVALLVILLAVLAGLGSSYMGIIDISPLLEYFGFGHEKLAQAPVPAKPPLRSNEKLASSPKQQQPAKAPPSQPASPVTTPPPASKAKKPVEPDTPTALPQSPLAKERIEGKASPVQTPNQSGPPDVAAKEEPQTVPAQTQPAAKPAAPEVASLRAPSPQYPYSVYLGSFKSSGTVNKALTEYQEKGLSVYWARVDLGDKGVWFRFFTGYFRTKEEAEKFIKDRNIQGATPGTTKYANFIGNYESDKEVKDRKQALVSAGFYPYTIKGIDGKSLIYSGAFDRKEYAEKEHTLLASKGIHSELVER